MNQSLQSRRGTSGGGGCHAYGGYCCAYCAKYGGCEGGEEGVEGAV